MRQHQAVRYLEIPKASAMAAVLLWLLMASLVQAQDTDGGFLRRDDVQSYITRISQENDLDSEEVSELLAGVRSQQAIIDSISKPAERTLTWREYRPIFLTQKRIDEGHDFYIEHKDLLEQAEERFGVPASVITAIIGVETFYGTYTGTHRVLEALATLAFDYPPRSEFFTSELTAFIVLSQAQGWDAGSIMGSYAGAMGLPQFIASSYREYAIDFDDDGKRDLFNSDADVIGSVANYLARHGWVAQATIAEQWLPEGGINQAQRALVTESLRPSVAPGTLRSMDFDTAALKSAEAQDSLASVMTMNGARAEELWVGYSNFYAITRYNHSRLYALAVFQLAEEIQAASS